MVETIQEETENNVQHLLSLHHFRSNVNLPLKEITKPAEIRINVTTTPNSEEIHFNEIFPMDIELFTLDVTLSDVGIKALKFLTKLFGNSFGNLKCLKLFGFPVNYLLWDSLHVLSLDWLHLTCSSMLSFGFHLCHLPKFRRLGLKLEENFDLRNFPLLPFSLEELSLHFSNIKTMTMS
jgi:hypothetical protein